MFQHPRNNSRYYFVATLLHLSGERTQRTDGVVSPRDGSLSGGGRPRWRSSGGRTWRTRSGPWCCRRYSRGCGRRRRRLLQQEVLQPHLVHAGKPVHGAFQRPDGLVKNLRQGRTEPRDREIKGRQNKTTTTTTEGRLSTCVRKPTA